MSDINHNVLIETPLMAAIRVPLHTAVVCPTKRAEDGDIACKLGCASADRCAFQRLQAETRTGVLAVSATVGEVLADGDGSRDWGIHQHAVAIGGQ
jgi:hypothetical protein